VATLSIPPRYELYGPTVMVLKEKGGSATVEEIVNGVASAMNLSDTDVAMLHGPGPRTELDYQLAWVRTELKNAGLLTNSERRVWSLTPRGRDTQLESALGSLVNRATGSEQADQLPLEGSEEWKEHVLSLLLSISPASFERLAQRILREKGFIQVTVEGRTGDGGIDGRGVLRLSLVGLTVVFQCKRQRTPVGPDVVRQLRGTVEGRADRGLLLTTSRYTPKAEEEAIRTSPAIELLDGDDVCELLRELRLGVTSEMVERVRVDRGFFESI
jgi:restriction system protein